MTLHSIEQLVSYYTRLVDLAPLEGFIIYLKPADIIIITEQSPHGLNGLSGRVPGSKHDTHVDQGLYTVGPQQAEIPGHGSSPIMAHHEHFVHGQRIEESDEVADDVEGGVGRRRGRRVGVAVAAEVRCDGAVAEGGEGEKLVAPRIPKLREAVDEEYHWPCPN